MDYKRAFDTIDHVILCKKFSFYGLDKNSVKWCENYLSNRKQYVKLDDVKSTVQPLNI